MSLVSIYTAVQYVLSSLIAMCCLWSLVTHQLKIECATGNVFQPRLTFLPLYHMTNIDSGWWVGGLQFVKWILSNDFVNSDSKIITVRIVQECVNVTMRGMGEAWKTRLTWNWSNCSSWRVFLLLSVLCRNRFTASQELLSHASNILGQSLLQTANGKNVARRNAFACFVNAARLVIPLMFVVLWIYNCWFWHIDN